MRARRAIGSDPSCCESWSRDGLSAADSPVPPAELGALIKLIDEGKISGKQAKDVLVEMFKTGKGALAIIQEQGLVQVSDTGEIDALIDEVIAANPDQVANYRAGKEALIGFFVGQVIKASHGKANPKIVNERLRAKLKRDEYSNNSVAVVTGGTKGIGRAIAQALVVAGVNVSLSARHEDEIKKTLAELNELGGGRCVGFVCDVRDESQVKSFFANTVKALGGLDILVNNAGIGIFEETVETTSGEDFRAVIETNLCGVFYCCHEAIPVDEAARRWLHHQHLFTCGRKRAPAHGRLQRVEVWFEWF